jgi:L-ascorbate metabolism protein UlaG (beta-lactamase superfamily)
MPRLIHLGLALMGLIGFAPSAAAAENEGCPKLVAWRGARIIPAALVSDEVRLTFLGHATFLIESPGGVRVATDYNGYVRPADLPDVVTMNHAHTTHYTDRPDPAIKHVLRGWDPAGGVARHDVVVQDVHVRNVPTNIRNWGGATEFNGNSIFVFDVSGLCIAHLGHLHHTLAPEHLKQIGRIDVVLVPVDGSYTLDIEGMLEVLQALGAPVVIPMHFFGPTTLERFLDRMRERHEIMRQPTPSIVLSRATLPAKPRVVVLPGH